MRSIAHFLLKINDFDARFTYAYRTGCENRSLLLEKVERPGTAETYSYRKMGLKKSIIQVNSKANRK